MNWQVDAWGLVAVLPLVWVVHSLPHLPGDVAASPMEVPGELASRGADLIQGDDLPYPVHVDEHYHLAQMAEIDRSGHVDINDPYTGAPSDLGLFTVSGMRTERGWEIGLVQLSQLTDVSLPTLSHFLPAIWTTYLAFVVWVALRPAPGALASAAFVVLIPTTVRFLGPGFLIPSSFGLPWIIAVLFVAIRARGPGRFIALLLLITGAFFIHMVPGVLALVAGLTAALVQPGKWRDRVALAASVALPLVWIVPAIRSDAVAAVTSEHDLPFEPGIFHAAGWPVLGLAIIGTAVAFYRRIPQTVPHRVLLGLCLGTSLTMAWSIDAGHASDATYSRLVQPFFLSLGCLAGLGVGAVAVYMAGIPFRGLATAGIFLAVIVAAGAALHPLQTRLNEPYYRLYDAPSWQAAEDFAASGAGQDDVFLSHPWQAPMYNAVSGARPWTVLRPGSPPERGEDYDYYIASGGANATWLKERDISWVLAPVPPNAPHSATSTGINHLAS
ncbi:MAG TPA: hypothetical protein VM327_10475 [Candidatus Thermoplasmatota archaeon]|nr:hypothetical protein [Candidatus Thermoplasmatota archaeon]